MLAGLLLFFQKNGREDDRNLCKVIRLFGPKISGGSSCKKNLSLNCFSENLVFDRA